MRALQRAIGLSCGAAMWLVLPLALLLFLQWPLRDVVQGHSREANDLGQLIFGVYVAVAITAATREGAHLALHASAHSSPARRRFARVAAAIVLVPWAAFIAVTAALPAWQSLLQMERFADTLNPGYFLLRAAVVLLAALVLAQAIADLASPLE